ncbi:hypothetical protein SAMN05444401_1902 [Clostridium amylolyticum]|uniref:N(4)-bis(aminopropyl)spermidine synthase C-terminal domain-containing protein n=1 Tax=Clostridium amylolyticum TaxID=1121298 RepID=A0A1M6FDN8_9CLOT|nr:hypothetical protein SAMN05444401_1902 [Clostridium amylolyticum]
MKLKHGGIKLSYKDKEKNKIINKDTLFCDYIEEVSRNVNIKEGKNSIEKILVDVYFKEGISTKELARNNFLPIPLITAIKREFIKCGLLIQDRGVRLTVMGRDYIENELGFKGLNKELYKKLLLEPWKDHKEIIEIKDEINEIFINRPQADVTIDQSKCTVDTAIKRAVLALINHALISKKILCVGDDDLVSIAISFLLKKLFADIRNCKTSVLVMDIDERILSYIKSWGEKEGLPISCEHIDFRRPIANKLKNSFDCFFTDPPYTLQGMNLFVSRGLQALKKENGIPIFLSYAHKSPDCDLAMQKCFIEMGLMVSEIIPTFNNYEGAAIIGNTGQMIILKTTSESRPLIEEDYKDAIYTGELNVTVRYYECKQCGKIIKIGVSESFKIIEDLKGNGCSSCRGKVFKMVERAKV